MNQTYTKRILYNTQTLKGNFKVLCLKLNIFNTLPFGRKTHIITDHKPLLPLFQRSLTNTTLHLSRPLLHVSEFHVQLYYQPQSRMTLSDVLSRQSNHFTEAGNKTEIKA